MGIDLASAGFAFDAEWYWRLTETSGAFGASAARAVLLPLARLAAGQFAIDDIVADPGERLVQFSLEGAPVAIEVGIEPAGAAADRFVIDLNRHLRQFDCVFALVVPRRYQLRGVLLPRSVLVDHMRDPLVIAPSDRRNWRRFARGTTNPVA